MVPHRILLDSWREKDVFMKYIVISIKIDSCLEAFHFKKKTYYCYSFVLKNDYVPWISMWKKESHKWFCESWWACTTPNPEFGRWDMTGRQWQALARELSRLGKDFLADRFSILCNGERGWDWWSVKAAVAYSVLLKNMASIHTAFTPHIHSTVQWLVLSSKLQVKTIQFPPTPVRD